MKKLLSLPLLALALSAIPVAPVASGYSYYRCVRSDGQNVPVRWPTNMGGAPITADPITIGCLGTESQKLLFAPLAEAFTQWSKQGFLQFQLRLGSRCDAAEVPTLPNDGKNVAWMGPKLFDDEVAVNWGTRKASDCTIIEQDIVFHKEYFDSFQNVETKKRLIFQTGVHAVGHALGLFHEDHFPSCMSQKFDWILGMGTSYGVGLESWDGENYRYGLDTDCSYGAIALYGQLPLEYPGEKVQWASGPVKKLYADTGAVIGLEPVEPGRTVRFVANVHRLADTSMSRNVNVALVLSENDMKIDKNDKVLSEKTVSVTYTPTSGTDPIYFDYTIPKTVLPGSYLAFGIAVDRAGSYAPWDDQRDNYSISALFTASATMKSYVALLDPPAPTNRLRVIPPSEVTWTAAQIRQFLDSYVIDGNTALKPTLTSRTDLLEFDIPPLNPTQAHSIRLVSTRLGVTLTANFHVNTPPTVNTQPTALTLKSGRKAVIVAHGSDPEGSALSYFWRQVNPKVRLKLLNPNTARLTVQAPRVTRASVEFLELRVTDAQGLATKRTVKVTVKP